MGEVERIARAYRDMEARGDQRWSLANAGNRRILAERRAAFHKLLQRERFLPLNGKRILEVGCGTGTELAWMLELGAAPHQLVGIDLLADRIDSARRSFPEIEFRQANAEHLELPSASVDIALAITVFSSILDATMSRRVASEISRVVRPGGGLLWYDVRYDSNSNHSVKAVGKRSIWELFPEFDGELTAITLAPPVARRLGVFTTTLYPVLSLAPPLRSHLCGLLRKRGA